MNKLAICYDFDKTLSPTDMQAQGLIQSLGMEPNEFWDYCTKFSVENNVEENLSYMFCLKDLAEKKGVEFSRESLKAWGKSLAYFDGVTDWFGRINEFGRTHGVEVRHFLISSGLKEIVEGAQIAKEFDKIYASSYYFDESGKAKWCSLLVNYTNKTQFLFRISKGCYSELDKSVNDRFPSDCFALPFKDFVYIGDSDTDIPCMALINKHEGTTIGVYPRDGGEPAIKKADKLLADGRIKYATIADYTEGGKLDAVIKNLIVGKSLSGR